MPSYLEACLPRTNGTSSKGWRHTLSKKRSANGGQRKLQDATNGDTRAHCRRKPRAGVWLPPCISGTRCNTQPVVRVQYPVGSRLVSLPVVSSQVVLPSERPGAPWAGQPLFATVFLCVQVPLQICSGAESSPASNMRTAIGFPMVATMMSVFEHSISKNTNRA